MFHRVFFLVVFLYILVTYCVYESHERGSPTTDEINTEQFMDNVLPASERTPYLIYFFHDFCDRCEDWSETLSEIKTDIRGIKMAKFKVITGTKVTTYCNVYVQEVPQLVLVLNRKLHPFQGPLSVETVKQFVYDHLPSNTTRYTNVNNVNDILSMESRIINNKPVVLLVSPQETPSLEYKIAAFNYQQYLIFYYLSSLADGNSHMLQKLNVKSNEHILRVYTDIPEPVEISLEGDQIKSILEKHKFLTLPEVDSCVLLDELCPVGEDKNWCLLLITADRTMKITNEFHNMATNWNNKRFKFGSLNINQDSILRQSIPSLNVTSQDHLCYNRTNSKSILLLSRPSVHILKYEWFDKYCGTQENNTKLSKLLQSDRIILPHTVTVSESCWFLPVQTIDHSEKIKTALLVVTSMFPLIYLVLLYCHWNLEREEISRQTVQMKEHTGSIEAEKEILPTELHQKSSGICRPRGSEDIINQLQEYTRIRNQRKSDWRYPVGSLPSYPVIKASPSPAPNTESISICISDPQPVKCKVSIFDILSRRFWSTIWRSSEKDSSPSEAESSDDESLDSSPEWPCNTDRDECERRNDILMDYIRGHNWYKSQEFNLLRRMIMRPQDVSGWKHYYQKYPLLYDWEWESHGSGKGDLLCTDGDNRFLVVELKSLLNSGIGSGRNQRTGRRKKRREGESQAWKFAEAWHNGNPQVKSTTGIFVTNEETQFIVEFDEHGLVQKERVFYC